VIGGSGRRRRPLAGLAISAMVPDLMIPELVLSSVWHLIYATASRAARAAFDAAA
jgi:hypothetical protein